MKQISKKIKIYTSGQNHTKMNITIEFFILKLLWVPVFSWNGHFQFFGLNFLTKGTYFYSKTDKIDIDIEFCTFEVVFVSNLTYQIYPREIFMFKNRKSEHHHWIPGIQISLGTKFQPKLTILIFLTRFTQKEFLRSKTEKVIITYFLDNSSYSN